MVSGEISASSPPTEEEGVGGQHAGAAGVGDDGEARALGAGLLGKDLGHVEEVGDIVDAQDAGAPEGGVEHVVAAGERAGVGGGGFGSRRRCGRA